MTCIVCPLRSFKKNYRILGATFLLFKSSAIVTGTITSEWTVYDENKNCFILHPEMAGDGIAKFIRSLAEETRAVGGFNGLNIVEVTKGCRCPRYCRK